MQNIIHSRYYNIDDIKYGRYLVQTRSHAKSSGIIPPAEYGIDKGINPNVSPEKQVIKPTMTPEVKCVTQNKPRLGQGRAGIKRKMKVQSSPQLTKPVQLTSKTNLWHPGITTQPKTLLGSRPQTKYIPILQKISGVQAKPKMVSRKIPTYPNPIYRPPPKPGEKPPQDMPRKLTD